MSRLSNCSGKVGGVLFAYIPAPPMKLLGTALVCDLVFLIRRVCGIFGNCHVDVLPQT